MEDARLFVSFLEFKLNARARSDKRGTVKFDGGGKILLYKTKQKSIGSISDCRIRTFPHDRNNGLDILFFGHRMPGITFHAHQRTLNDFGAT